MSGNPITCEKALGFLDEYRTGELAPDVAAAVQAHVETCSACAEALQADVALGRLIQESAAAMVGNAKAPAGVSDRVREITSGAQSVSRGMSLSRWHGIAAVLALVAFFGALSVPAVRFSQKSRDRALAYESSRKPVGAVSSEIAPAMEQPSRTNAVSEADAGEKSKSRDFGAFKDARDGNTNFYLDAPRSGALPAASPPTEESSVVSDKKIAGAAGEAAQRKLDDQAKTAAVPGQAIDNVKEREKQLAAAAPAFTQPQSAMPPARQSNEARRQESEPLDMKLYAQSLPGVSGARAPAATEIPTGPADKLQSAQKLGVVIDAESGARSRAAESARADVASGRAGSEMQSLAAKTQDDAVSPALIASSVSGAAPPEGKAESAFARPAAPASAAAGMSAGLVGDSFRQTQLHLSETMALRKSPVIADASERDVLDRETNQLTRAKAGAEIVTAGLAKQSSVTKEMARALVDKTSNTLFLQNDPSAAAREYRNCLQLGVADQLGTASLTALRDALRAAGQSVP